MKKLLLAITFLLVPFITVPLIEAQFANEPGPLEPGQEIVTLNPRRGVSMRVLLAKPKADVKGTFIFFPGGSGTLVGKGGRVRKGFTGQRGTGFFAEQGFVAVLVGRPSDQQYERPLSNDYRTSSDQIKDIKKVIEWVSQKWSKPIFLIGHSRGTVSAADLAADLKDNRIRGVVLSGSQVRRIAGVRLRELRLKSITVPVLFVHHKDDGCFDIEVVRKLKKRFKKSSKVDFIEVVGGNSPPDHDDCRGGQNPHTFWGQEKEVIKAVADWAEGKPVPERIGR